MKALRVQNIITPDGINFDVTVIFDNKVLDVVKGSQTPSHVNADIIEVKGLILAPGFIDIHTHGMMGADTMYGKAAVLSMAENAVKFGVTSIIPTTVSSSEKDLSFALSGIRDAMREINKESSSRGANILGAHVEGPFISKKYKGAHLEEYLRLPDASAVSEYADVIRIVTLAPELDGAMEFIDWAINNNIRISIGHTEADYELCTDAIHRGASSFTHTFNAMSPLQHRNPGAVGAAMNYDAYAEFICDNIHVHPAVARVLYAAKNRKNLILITDSISAAGLGDGGHKLGFQDVHVENGKATLPDGTIAGSVLTLDKAVRNFNINTGTSMGELIRCSSTNAANMLGLNKGHIKTGYDADFILLDSKFNVHGAFVSGARIF